MNADERNLLAELNAAVDDDGEDGRPATGSRSCPMTAATWGCCPALRHPGELLTPRRRVPRARGPRAASGRRRRRPPV